MSEAPDAFLAIECYQTNPQRPISIGVFTKDRKLIAVVTLDEFDRCARALEEKRAKLRSEP